eukprot:gb/GECG01016607.1/.p1 GENE.gb/GECG01016607.1/~~gb/GECG01016607.1/.p1  ORF type:complete len:438 (+),score=42.87 gb/GECG01016607.1/:1-1314(+)
MSGENNETETSLDDQIRVRFRTEHTEYRVMESPFSIPTALNPSGLNDVINHLLEANAHQRFSFFVRGHFLQSSLNEFCKKHGISKEEVLQIDYTPEQTQIREEKEETLPDWVSCVSAVGDYAFAGCYDGSLRVYSTTLNREAGMLHNLRVHDEAITCLCSVAQEGSFIVFTGSKNGRVNRSIFDIEKETLTNSELNLEHDSSVSSVLVTQDRERLCSGTWDGAIYLWNLAEVIDWDASSRKSRRLGQDSANRSHNPDIEPTNVISDAHKNSVSGFCWGEGGALVSASWDHSLKVWETTDNPRCIRTLHCNKVITSVASSNFGTTLVTGHPDKAIRLWDLRSGSEQSDSTYETRSSHTSWVSSVAWSRDTDYTFASLDYNGRICVWDTRAVKPIYEIDAHEGKGLCIDWNVATDAKDAQGVCKLVSGGSDKKLKMYNQ